MENISSTHRERYERFIIIVTLLLLIYRGICGYEVYPYMCDIVLMLFTLLIFIYLTCNRLYIMTYSRLKGYSRRDKLEYRYYNNINNVEDIEVRVYKVKSDTYSDWYKLDNIITIGDKCSYNVFKSFMSYNDSVGSLLHTMRKNKEDVILGGKYIEHIHNYYTRCYIGLFIYLLYIGIHFIYILYRDGIL